MPPALYAAGEKYTLMKWNWYLSPSGKKYSYDGKEWLTEVLNAALAPTFRKEFAEKNPPNPDGLTNTKSMEIYLRTRKNLMKFYVKQKFKELREKRQKIRVDGVEMAPPPPAPPAPVVIPNAPINAPVTPAPYAAPKEKAPTPKAKPIPDAPAEIDDWDEEEIEEDEPAEPEEDVPQADMGEEEVFEVDPEEPVPYETNSLVPPTIDLNMGLTIEDMRSAPLLDMLNARERLYHAAIQRARNDFFTFVKWMKPEMVISEHHEIICNALTQLERGEIKKLMIFGPPGSSKTTLCSHLFPLWCFGRNPSWYILSCSHTQDYATGNGKIVRNLMDTEEFKTVFPGIYVSTDTRAGNRWMTNRNGVYTAAGVGTAIAGKRGHIGIIDDALSEQSAKSDRDVREINQWYYGGFESRIMPSGGQLIINTRWRVDDLSGYLLEQEKMLKENGELIGDEWVVIKIPAILDEESALLLNKKAGDSYFSPTVKGGYGWPIERLQQLKRQYEMAGQSYMWSALYQQHPVAHEGNLFQREWFQEWPGDEPPDIIHTIMVLDPAYTDKKDNDPSAYMVWGLFKDDGGLINMIPIASKRDHMQFPQLVAAVKDAIEDYMPDNVIIEGKASGKSLIQTMRQRGIPVQEFNPDKRGDKKMRAIACGDILSSGKIWLPLQKKWAMEFLEEALAFPYGKHDDLVDCFTMAVLFAKDTHLLMHREQETEWLREQEDQVPRKPRKYY